LIFNLHDELPKHFFDRNQNMKGNQMINAAKFACIASFALGIASALGLLPDSWSILATIALVLFAAHLLEVIVMFKHVKLYKGSLIVSIVLTLLFGLLHWRPLARQAARDASETQQ
jgi:hypothetical protein